MDRLSLMQDMADDLDEFEDDIEPYTRTAALDMSAEERVDRVRASIAFHYDNPYGSAGIPGIYEVERAYEVTFE